MKLRIALLLLPALILGSCNHISKDEFIESEIKSSIAKNQSALSNIKSMYNIIRVYKKDKESNWDFGFFSDNSFYLRSDIATVYLGYPISSAKISVEKNTLKIRLPKMETLAIDRYIKSISTNDPGMIPKDSKTKEYLNIDKDINDRIVSTIRTDKSKLQKVAFLFASQYFAVIAEKYGLQLDIAYSDDVATGDEPRASEKKPE